MTTNAPRIKVRKPTGAVPWPLILIEGPEKSGKSWKAAEFTADERLGQAYWLDLGEGAADEYAAIPGADYLVVDHDGTWADIIGQISAIHAEASRAHAVGEKPVVLVIDSMTAEWDMLKDWVGHRARQSNYAKRQLQRDPSAEIKPAMNLWNDANGRHAQLMRLLMTFPGIVLVTARGKEVAQLDESGKPIPGVKDYRVEGHRTLAFDCSAWVRLSRESAPLVVGARSVHHGVQPGVDKPKPAPDFSVSWLVFDVLKCDPATAKVRELQPLHSDEPEVEQPASVTEMQPRRSSQVRPVPAEAAPDLVVPDLDAVLVKIADTWDVQALRDTWTGYNLNAAHGEHASRLSAAIKAQLQAIEKRQQESAHAEVPDEPTHDEAVETVTEALDAEIVEAS